MHSFTVTTLDILVVFGQINSTWITNHMITTWWTGHQCRVNENNINRHTDRDSIHMGIHMRNRWKVNPSKVIAKPKPNQNPKNEDKNYLSPLICFHVFSIIFLLVQIWKQNYSMNYFKVTVVLYMYEIEFRNKISQRSQDFRLKLNCTQS